MKRLFAVLALAACIAFPARAEANGTCPVLYRYSQQACYSPSTATQAEAQMPERVVNPVAAVHRLTALPLTSIGIDRTRRDTHVLHVWNISYVFGRAPNLGLRLTRVPHSTQFLVITEAVGRIHLQQYARPQLERIHIGVGTSGRSVWHLAVNFPHRNLSLVMHSTLSRAAVERIAILLMQ